MAENIKPSELAAIVATVDPDAYSTGAQNTDWVDMQKWESAAFLVLAGIIASSGTLDFKLQEATSSTGAGAADLSGFSIVQFTTGDNDKQAWVNLQAPALSAGFRYVRGVMTFTTAGGDAGVVGLGFAPRRGPASDFDLTTVDEIVK